MFDLLCAHALTSKRQMGIECDQMLTVVRPSVAFLMAAIFGHVILRVNSEHLPLLPQNSMSADTIKFPVCPTRCTCSMTSQLSIYNASLTPTVNCSSGIELSSPILRLPNKTEAILLSGYPIDLLSLATVILRDCAVLRLLAVNGARLQSLNGLAAPESLISLDLSYNFLSMVADRAFIRVTSVRRLDLSHNRLESINHDAFYGLQDLVELDLSSNRLGTNMDSTSSRWICCLPNINQLNLSRNGYHVIHDSFFDCRSSHNNHKFLATPETPFVTSSPPLRDLDLGVNRIRHVAEHAFVGLDDIAELRLNDNALIAIPFSTIRQVALAVGAFGLDLSGNEFDVIETGSFNNSGRLERLRLSRLDRLRLIERHAFVNMTSLQSLDLSHCRRLRYVHPNAFSSVPSLAVFNLSDANLETLEKDVIRPLHGLRQLDIRSNPLICDCTTNWLRSSTTSSNSSVDISMDRSFCRLHEATPDGEVSRTSTVAPNWAATTSRGKKLPKLERGNDVLATSSSALLQQETSPTVDQNSTTPSELWQTANGNSGSTSRRNASPIYVDRNVASVEHLKQAFADDRQTPGFDQSLMSSCRPRILPLFDADVQVAATDSLRLDCIAVGPPTLSTSWILPAPHDASALVHSDVVDEDEQLMYEDENSADLTQVKIISGTLLIRAVTMHHRGNYTCLATVAGDNGSHVDERIARVRVKASNTGLIVLRVTSSTLTVTWRGLQTLREYRVRYRERRDSGGGGGSVNATSDGTSGDIIVKPYMRSFTASDLRPDTEYVFCIDIRQSPNAVAGSHVTVFPSSAQHGLPPFVTVNCTVAVTRHRKYADHLVRSRGVHVLVLCVTAFASASLVVAMATLITRRYDRRKRRQMALETSTAATSSVALDTSQLQLTSSGSMTSCATANLTFENRVAILQQQQEQQDECSGDRDEYDFVPMFDSDDLEEIRMTTSMQL